MKRPFSAYEGDERYVFACYAHEDQALVYPDAVRPLAPWGCNPCTVRSGAPRRDDRALSRAAASGGAGIDQAAALL